MIILGDAHISCEATAAIKYIEAIAQTQPNSTLLFNYTLPVLQYCSKNSLPYGVLVCSLKEAIYANALNAKYIVCKRDIAKQIQAVAENYMYDAKVLAIIENNDELEAVANDEIDGVIYSTLLEGLAY